MSVVLAIESATDQGSVAVGRGGRLLAEVAFAGRRHAAMLVPSIEHGLRLAGVTYDDLTEIALADGPGSFTGLRIGTATAAGISTDRDLPLWVCPSLMVCAWMAAAEPGAPVASFYDALRGEVFGAVYAFHHDKVRTLVAPIRTTVDGLAERCAPPAVAVGDGAAAHAEAIERWTGRPPLLGDRGAPRASGLIALRGLAGSGRPAPAPATFEPHYGRPAEAQARWEREHGRRLPDTTRYA